VFKTTNGGGSWKQVNTGLNPGGKKAVFALAIDPSNTRIIYAGTGGLFLSERAGVFRSTNGGESWCPMNNGLTNFDIVDLAIDSAGSTLHAATAGGGEFDFQFA
jgi:photosystem II stability/assembly factor-like uncharacterized protein